MEKELFEMTAQEMFEELGYELIHENEHWFYYVFKKNEACFIRFYKDNKTICCWSDYEPGIDKPMDIDILLLKAINKQVEELGWIQ